MKILDRVRLMTLKALGAKEIYVCRESERTELYALYLRGKVLGEVLRDRRTGRAIMITVFDEPMDIETYFDVAFLKYSPMDEILPKWYLDRMKFLDP